ncbi:histidine--tRNA ligase [Blattabacterium sp. (Cryptocercus kyebangensis)]|uniref:histidine--tRNA ligase n=1 Tax=Blattabacterium sp. (Cryptocercus kyebangensis) TaxID=298656 RepID=UPI000D7C21BE|nr:histidine--tRNA ligase [Blattabacterium sp. (Cryptocercus kyebangensis)]AWU43783.1 histidine--tRNA ligase [Blattabacterium sp. (Cryptocercus kyebangensis)]
MENPSIPKGTRDFSSMEMNRRNYLIQIIKNEFELFGFYPIETPSFENISTLIGKYGKEGDYLMFRLLHSGNFLKKGISDFLMKKKENKVDLFKKLLTEHISNKALRYDLTIPFVRYVVMHRNEIFFPFKRYQIQPVWRADKPQKGRFREFYQCDADVIGTESLSLWPEIELIQLCDEIFTKLNFPIIIHINHRDILGGLVEISGIENNLWKDFTTSLDKWNKMGRHIVRKEMLSKGISSESFEKIACFFDMKENFSKKIESLTFALKYSKRGKKGIQDLSFIFRKIKNISLKKTKLEWNISLARGMNYYTGTIFEILPKNNKESSHPNSIGGGGRYDQLSSFFGMKNFSGVGVSLGLDRIYLSMIKENLFQNISSAPSKVLFINFGDEEVLYAYNMINFLRKKGISTQLYPNAVKINKQFRYANDNNIPFTISIGKNEIEKNKIRVKNIKKRVEIEYDNINDFFHQLRKNSS